MLTIRNTPIPTAMPAMAPGLGPEFFALGVGGGGEVVVKFCQVTLITEAIDDAYS
jgi:hypothetical protein